MKLMTKKLAGIIPRLYETENIKLSEKVVYTRYFHPLSSWNWYVLEYDGNDLCFGLVKGHEFEFGYFSINELKSIKICGIGIERDLYFCDKPRKTIADIYPEVLSWEKD